MQIIITMAGLGQRFKDTGEAIPKPFIEVGNQSVLKHLTDILPLSSKLFFAVGEHLRSAETEKKISKLGKKNYEIVYVPYSPRGPVDTVSAVLPLLDLARPVLVSYCDFTIQWDREKFLTDIKNTNADAAIISYRGFHPTYLGPNSYCHLQVDQNNFVTDLQEKKLYTESLYTEWTSCGMYYFKSHAFLKQCLLEQLKQNLCYTNKTQSEFYTSLAIQAMKNVFPQTRILNYQVDYFIQFGTPFDIDRYRFWHSYFVLKKELTGAHIEFTVVEENYWKNYFLLMGHI